MPIYEYECKEHGRFEVFFTTFSVAQAFEGWTQCMATDDLARLCLEPSPRVMSVPCEAMLYGNPDGYHKPSATKRHSTKLVSSIEGNKGAAG